MSKPFDESLDPSRPNFWADGPEFWLSVGINLTDLKTVESRAKSKISGREIKCDSADFRSAIISGLGCAEALLIMDRTRIDATITALQERRKQFEQEGIPK